MSIYVTPRTTKAGPVGPGAGPLLTEPHLGTILGNSPQKKMQQAWKLGISVPWIRAAERVVSDACSSVAWHLEDANGDTINDETTDVDALAIQALIEKPQRDLKGKRLTRRGLWGLTFRHMGLCGNAFHYLDQVNGLGVPTSVLYIRPDRMTPRYDDSGTLSHWSLDARPGFEGTRLELAEVIQFVLQEPDEGAFGPGLVESALLKADLSQGADRHALSVLAAGGRLAGLLSPKQGAMDDPAYRQIVNDARTIVEQPDAAKRLQVLRAPVDFTSTAMTMDEAKVVDLMERARDDLLALWGVPPSQLGIPGSMGLNSGDSRKYDEAAFWQNANHPRLVSFTEAIQYQLLDCIPAAPLQLVIEEPEFDDEAPRYDLLQKSAAAPLTNRERREIIGLEPFGDERDYEVWLPMTVQMAFPTPNEQGVTAAMPEPEPVVAPGPIPPMPPAKADLRTSLGRIRETVDRAVTPRLAASVHKVLDEQQRAVAAWIRTHAEHVASNPKDRVWWNPQVQDAAMRRALAPAIVVMASQTTDHIRQALPAKALPLDAATRALTRGAARVTAINRRTQDAIASFIATGIAQGQSPAEVADALEAAVLQNGAPAFDELRAETIARTELMDAYNGAALASYQDSGITTVQAIDGDMDEECADRNGREFSIADADGIEDHPNGTLDWVPVFGKAGIGDRTWSSGPSDEGDWQAAARIPNTQRFVTNVHPPDMTPIADVLRTLGDRVPIVNITPPDIRVEAPSVSIEPPVVNVTTPDVRVDVAAPAVTVAVPEQKPRKRTVKRDAEGQITGIEDA